MAYTINLTDGAVFATIADGTINTASSMTLVGKNYAGYGEFLDENFIHLLENSANSTAPGAPLTGQLWYDTANSLLKVYSGSIWKTISAATASSSQPSSNVTGDLWYNTTGQQLYVWTGAAWLLVGPAYSSSQGQSGAIPLSINDTGATPHIVTGLYANNSLVSVINPGSGFTPAAPYSTAFPYIYSGTTVWNTGVQSGNISTPGSFTVTSGGNTTVTVTNTGATITGFASATGNITGSYYFGNGSQLTGVVVGGGTPVSTTGNITGGNINTAGLISATGNITGGNIIAITASYTPAIYNTGSNGVGNIGSSSGYFNTVFAKATSAQYADLAERFEADEYLEAGTVVELGGVAEITKAKTELSEEVFGVISTRAAYLMNGAAGEDNTHPPVAMTGRVPVKVLGAVRKGQRLVSAGNGIARAAQPGEANSFNVIGRALAQKTTADLGIVEAIVTIKN